MTVHTAVDRLSSADLLNLAAETTGVPMQVGAVLLLDRPGPASLVAVREVLADRVVAIPRFRQRLLRAPFGCGRPYWADDGEFSIDRHVAHVACPPPGDDSALFTVVAATVTRPLPRDRPLWSVAVVDGLTGGRTALIVVVHHVLTDGIGGLAVLAHLVDGAPPVVPDPEFPRRPPHPLYLARDAAARRVAALSRAADGLRLLEPALAELWTGGVRAPRCSLNRPTGTRRVLASVRGELAAVRAVAHAHGATVNDAILTAVGGALGQLLRHRGEHADTVVVSVPISNRSGTDVADLGNQVGVMPTVVPTGGALTDRLEQVARHTRDRKSARGASAAVLDPVFRALARLGVLRRFVDRQHLVTTVVSNLRGPRETLRFLGSPVTAVLPVSFVTGNVTIGFAVLSYAGTLHVTITADPDRCPDLPVLTAALQEQFDDYDYTALAL